MNFRNNNLKPKSNEPEYDRKILNVARVTRTVAGGRRFSFRTTMAIGNRKGVIGVGVGKGKDVAQSMDKAYKKAQKEMMEVIKDNGTIPVDIVGHFKSARVLLRPAKKGKGLIAGGAVRSLCDLAGIENISAKILSKSNNKLNIARATLDAFKQIRRFSLRPNNKNIYSKKKIVKKEEKNTTKNDIKKIEKNQNLKKK